MCTVLTHENPHLQVSDRLLPSQQVLQLVPAPHSRMARSAAVFTEAQHQVQQSFKCAFIFLHVQ